MTRLEKILKEQYNFLKKSCIEYDNGDFSEGKRIALILRVLLHNTRASHGLLAQLESENNIKVGILNKNIGFQSGLVYYVGATIQFKDGESKYIPMMDLTHPGLREISVDEWWKQGVILVGNYMFTRRDVMLSLVNKEGGAHVDPEEDEDFKLLTDGHLVTLANNSGNKIEGIDHVMARENGFYMLVALEKYFSDLIR